MTEQPPTQLARPVDATEASLAWAIDTTPEVVAYRPPWIARTAVAAALVLIAGAGSVAVWQLDDSSVTSPKVASKSATNAPTTGPVNSTSRETPPPPRPTSAPTPPPVDVESAALRKPPPPPEPTLAPPLWTVAHDAEFIATLRADGWSIWDEAAMANNAHYICTWLRNGDTSGAGDVAAERHHNRRGVVDHADGDGGLSELPVNARNRRPNPPGDEGRDGGSVEHRSSQAGAVFTPAAQTNSSHTSTAVARAWPPRDNRPGSQAADSRGLAAARTSALAGGRWRHGRSSRS